MRKRKAREVKGRAVIRWTEKGRENSSHVRLEKETKGGTKWCWEAYRRGRGEREMKRRVDR